MVVARAGGARGAGGGGAGQGPPPPPRIFSKVAARYAPLVLPVLLHDLPDNYMTYKILFVKSIMSACG